MSFWRTACAPTSRPGSASQTARSVMPYCTPSAGRSGGPGNGVADAMTCMNLICGGSISRMAVCSNSQMSRRAGAGSATAAARARASARRFWPSEMSCEAPTTRPANSSNRSSERSRSCSSSGSIRSTRVTSRISSALRLARFDAIRPATMSKLVAKAGPTAAPTNAPPGPPIMAPAAVPAVAAAICFKPSATWSSVLLFTD